MNRIDKLSVRCFRQLTGNIGQFVESVMHISVTNTTILQLKLNVLFTHYWLVHQQFLEVFPVFLDT